MKENRLFIYYKETFVRSRSESFNHFASFFYDGHPRFLHPYEMKQKKGSDAFIIPLQDLEFEIEINCYPEFNAIDWRISVTNTSNFNSKTLSNLSVMDLKIPLSTDIPIVHKGINGDSCTADSFYPFANPITCGDTVLIRPKGGKSSYCAFPFFDICGQTDGLICGIGWTGNWYYELIRDNKALTVKAGLPDARFYIKPHETLRLPRILLMAYEGDNTDAHNHFRRLMRDHYSPKKRFGDAMKMPIALQTFDRYYKSWPEWSSEKEQLKMADFGSKCQYCDTYWLDAAWFKDGFPKGVGNYTFREGFPEGLTNVANRVHANGLRNMVWLEPERVHKDTEMERKHPEFVLYADLDDWMPKKLENRWLFDMSNPVAVDFLIDLIGGFIDKYEIDIYRQDLCLFPEPFWRKKDVAGRKGITEIKYIEGEYRFLDALLERFPALLIDCCAGGGNRIDLETCTRCVFCWRSDTGCSPETKEMKTSVWNQNQNLSLSNYIIYHAIAAWEPVAYDVRSAMGNGFAANFEVNAVDFDFIKARKVLAECSHLRAYWEEDFYPLSVADLEEDHWAVYQFGNKSSGVVMVFRRENADNDEQMIPFRGLDTKKEYLLKITNEDYQTVEIRVSGKTLSDGYSFSLQSFRSSLAVEYLILT